MQFQKGERQEADEAQEAAAAAEVVAASPAEGAVADEPVLASASATPTGEPAGRGSFDDDVGDIVVE